MLIKEDPVEAKKLGLKKSNKNLGSITTQPSCLSTYSNMQSLHLLLFNLNLDNCEEYRSQHSHHFQAWSLSLPAQSHRLES